MATEGRNVITEAGLAKLQERLEYLLTVRRLEIAEDIKEARAFGDLSENAEYDEARRAQSQMEGEIKRLEETIRTAEVVPDSEIDTQVVSVGSFVRILDKEFNEEETYQIVGSAEADLAQGKLSNESPVGKALEGKKVGATVKVSTPGGIVRYKILEIHREERTDSERNGQQA